MTSSRECPACALDAPAESEACPYCGYEFPTRKAGLTTAAWLMIGLMILFGIPMLAKLIGFIG